MKLPWWRLAWIICLSLLVSAHTMIKTFVMVNLRLMTRAKADIITRLWATRMLNVVKIKRHIVQTQPLQFLPNRAYLLMSNHSSLYDIPLIFESIPGSVRMIAKKELYRIPLFGFALRTNEFVCIDRKNRQQSAIDLQEARRKMENGIILWAAPEGTRTRTGQLQAFKKGIFMMALETNAIVIPIGIRGVYDVLPPDTFDFKLNQSVSVHIGEPIDSTTCQDKETLMRLVAEQMSTLTDLPLPSQNSSNTPNSLTEASS